MNMEKIRPVRALHLIRFCTKKITALFVTTARQVDAPLMQVFGVNARL